MLRAIILGLASAIYPRRRQGGWYAGPIIGWKNYSHNVRLETVPGGLLQFELNDGNQIDALCLSVDALPQRLRLGYQLAGKVDPVEAVTPPLISVCFQRRWDSWTAEGRYQQYRWYYADAPTLEAGLGVLYVDFNNDRWSDVFGRPASENPEAFAAAKAKAGTIYITFGHSAGRSHGVWSSGGPALFKLITAERI
jgi:hypothetical protein